MRDRRLLILMVATLLLAGIVACDIGATATPTPAPTPTPVPTDTPPPPPTDTPEPTPEPTATPQEEAAAEMVTFDEPNGAFSLDYPAVFDDIEQAPDMGDLGYVFQGAGSDSLLFVAFSVVADKALNGFEWQRVAQELGPELLSGFGESFGAGGDFEETTRQMGQGTDHTMYLEATSADTQLHLASWIEESGGVMTMVFWFVPEPSWEKTSEVVSTSLDSYVWRPDAVRALAPVTEGGSSADTILEDEAAGGEWLTYEDADGVFYTDYPVEFGWIDGPDIDEDGYAIVFQTEDEAHYIGFYFGIYADSGMSDAEWTSKAGDMVSGITSEFADDATEVYHEEGDPGEHWVYTEAESASLEARQGIYIEEADGMLGMMMFYVSRNEWMLWEEKLIDALVSFKWSAQAARDVLENLDSGGAVVEPTPEIEPTEPAPPPISGCTPPSGQGGLLMFNCRSDVVTVDVIPDGVFQQLEAATGGDCRAGTAIYLNPGDHILRASIAGVPSQGEATITITAGECLPFSWE